MNILMTLLLPASLLGSLAAFAYARYIGGNLELAVLIPSLITLAVAMALEHITPFKPSWNKPQNDRLTDWLSFGVLAAAVQPTLKWLSPVVVVWAYSFLDHPAALFPSEAPFVLQVLLATLLVELGKYWAHRWHHTQRHLWWLHALHHSSERLYTINNFRFHPLNYVVNHVFSVLPLMLLGTPVEVMLAYVALSQPVLMLQHANLPLRHGWLNYIFSTNEIHRWHHSAMRAEGNSNYGSALMVWDIVFGTFRYTSRAPSHQATEPQSIGLFAPNHYPARKPYMDSNCAM